MTRDNTTYYVAIPIALILLYFLSPPVVVAIMGSAQIQAHPDVFQAIYTPAQWTYMHFPPYAYYIDEVMPLVVRP